MPLEPPIYVDFDDVLSQTARALMEFANREYGRSIRFHEIHSFNIGESFHLDEPQVERIMGLMHDDKTLRDLQPMPGAAQTLRRWAAAGRRITIVTGRPPSSRTASEAWLRNLAIPWSDFLFVDKYKRLHRTDPGSAFLTLDQFRELDFSLAVEDSADMAAFLVQTMRIRTILLERPWNLHHLPRSVLDDELLTACRDWGDIAARFADGAA